MSDENDDPMCATCAGWEGHHEVMCPCHPSSASERMERAARIGPFTALPGEGYVPLAAALEILRSK